jgi:hypothetical protein
MNKFKLGDVVYYLDHNNLNPVILVGKVRRIELKLTSDKDTIHYEIGNALWEDEFLEDYLFASKEDYLFASKIECIDNYIKLLEVLKNDN